MAKSAVEITKEIWRQKEADELAKIENDKKVAIWAAKRTSDILDQLVPIIEEYKELGVYMSRCAGCIELWKNDRYFGSINVGKSKVHPHCNPNVTGETYVIIQTHYSPNTVGFEYDVSQADVKDTNFVENFAREMANMIPREK